MEFEDQEEELDLAGASYESSRVKMASSEAMAGRMNQGKYRYRECLKNHAVGIGGHALDGCGEFMPAGAEGTLDALKCAACNCHRNFHRKETTYSGDPCNFQLAHHHPPPPPPHFSAYYRTPAGYLHVAGHHQRGAGAPTLALPSTSGGGGGGTQSTRDEQEEDMSNPNGGGGGSSKKRFRTKFTQEQKEKMLEMAERLGWRIQKHDEAVVLQFCNEIGVKRHVLKVWMHNNKHTLGSGTRISSGTPVGHEDAVKSI